MLHSRREAGKRKGRRRVIAASKRLFREKGYEDTVIEDVASEANVSKATVYNYFINKEGLLMGVMEEEISDINVFIASIDPKINGYEKICKLLTYQIMETRNFRDVERQMILIKSGNVRDNGSDAEIYDTMVSYIEEAKSQGVFKSDISTEIILSLINSFYLYAQFGWRDLESLDNIQCINQIKNKLSLILAGCFVS